MAVYPISCVSMYPLLYRRHLGVTCLLVETDQGPVLVDAGLGLRDYTNPSFLVRFYQIINGIKMDPENAAINQVGRLGWSFNKIGHIILSHLHFDHAGGLPDFPNAWIHILQTEYAAFRKPISLAERMGYNKPTIAHGPKWIFHEGSDSRWFGMDAIRLEFRPEILLLPLPGHTRGHCGVAIRTSNGWVLYASDAAPLNSEYSQKIKTILNAHSEIQVIAGRMGEEWFGENKKIS